MSVRGLVPVVAFLPLLLAACVPPAAAEPEHVHLGLPGGDAASARSVLWADAAPESAPAVTLVTAAGERVVAGHRVDGPSVVPVYEAELPALAPGADYSYRLGTRTFAFRTPPAALDAAAPLRFVALGDMGTTAEAAATEQLVGQLAPTFVLHSGDISYAEGDPVEWDAWFGLVEPLASSVPWITALGNHETYMPQDLPLAVADAPSPHPLGNTEIQYYRQVFGLPDPELWYSFDWEGVHFVALDTFSEPGGPSQDELTWLEQDLAAHEAAPWTVAFLHEPLYSSNAAHGSNPHLQEVLAPLFEAHGVDLVLQAHDHAYERTFPLRGGNVQAHDGNQSREGAGVVYLTSGGAGESLYATWQDPAPAWSAARKALYHVVVLEVTPSRLTTRAVAADGSAFEDGLAITKALTQPHDAGPPARAPGPGLLELVAPLVVGLLLLRTARGRRV